MHLFLLFRVLRFFSQRTWLIPSYTSESWSVFQDPSRGASCVVLRQLGSSWWVLSRWTKWVIATGKFFTIWSVFAQTYAIHPSIHQYNISIYIYIFTYINIYIYLYTGYILILYDTVTCEYNFDSQYLKISGQVLRGCPTRNHLPGLWNQVSRLSLNECGKLGA